MRIFLSSQQALRRHAVPAYAFWESYFKSAFAEAGHEVIEAAGVDWAEGLTHLEPGARARWLGTTWTKTVDFLRTEHARRPVDFFLGYLFPNQIDPSAVTTLRALGIPCVNFFCDHVREYRILPREFAPFDLHWVPEFKALPLYRRQGWKHLNAPMPCWIAPTLRRGPEQETPVVSFIGGRDPLRAALLADVARAGVPLEIRGASWREAAPYTELPPATAAARAAHWREFLRQQGVRGVCRRLLSRFAAAPANFDFGEHTRPMPSMDDYQRIIAESSVSLGINRYPSFRYPTSAPDTYSRLRDIEAPMLGACYLTEWTEGLDELYDLENEIAVYRTTDELVAQARALLSDPPRRQRLRAAGQRRALHEHSIARSVARIAAALGLKTT